MGKRIEPRKQRVYIAGPMRNKPQHNHPAFHEAEEWLRMHGYEPLNPARNFGGRTDLDYATYMREDIGLLLTADVIYLLPDWQESEGARLEYQIAKALSLEVIFAPGASSIVPCELEASSIVRAGKREAAYGHPGDDFRRTAAMWSTIHKRPVTPQEVALSMILLKVSRLMATPDHRDSLVDIVGYAVCYERLFGYRGNGCDG